MFWISAKPGSGKSTLMNDLYCNEKVCQIPDEASERPWLIVRVFFDFRAGHGVPNNSEGLFRSVNY